MAAADPARIQVSVHLDQHSAVSFDASKLWPREEFVADTGTDAASIAGVLMRRLTAEGFVGFSADASAITLIPAGAVKRVDVAEVPRRTDSR
jgi:hypothetical protein